MKKILCFALILAMALSAAGCGNAPYAQGTTAPQGSSPVVPATTTGPDDSTAASPQAEGPYFQNGRDVLCHGMPRAKVEAILGEADEEWNWERKGISSAIDFKALRKMTPEEAAKSMGIQPGQLGAQLGVSAEEWDSFFGGLTAATYEDMALMISYEHDCVVSILMPPSASSEWALYIAPQATPADDEYHSYVYSPQDGSYQPIEDEGDLDPADDGTLFVAVDAGGTGGFLEARHLGTIGFSTASASPPPTPSGSAAGNTFNGGAITAEGGWVYYADGENRVGGISKARADGTQHEFFATAVAAPANLVAYDGWVYFIAQLGQAVDGTIDTTRMNVPRIHRLKDDGTLVEQVFDYMDVISDAGQAARPLLRMTINDGWLYLNSSKGGIERVRIDGTDYQQLSTVITPNVDVCDGWIYFVDCSQGTISRMRTDGSSRQDFLTDIEGPAFTNILVDGDWIYCGITGGSLFRVNMGSSSREDLVTSSDDCAIRIFNMSDGWVYYSLHESIAGQKRFSLYKIRVDGTDQSLLCEDSNALIMGIYVAGDWLYLYHAGLPGNIIPPYTSRMHTDGSNHLPLG